MTYFIADTHFNHKNIIEYCSISFKDTCDAIDDTPQIIEIERK